MVSTRAVTFEALKARRHRLTRVTRLSAATLVVAALPAVVSAQAVPNAAPPAHPKSSSQNSKFHLPLAFKTSSSANGAPGRFVAQGAGYALSLAPTQAVFALGKGKSSEGALQSSSAHYPGSPSRFPIVPPPYHFDKTNIPAPTAQQGTQEATNTNVVAQNSKSKVQNLTMSLAGANANAVGTGASRLSAVVNEYIGNNPKKWRVGVPLYSRVGYREVYRGVDVVYYGNGRQLEYDFVVAPHADPKPIELAFSGTKQAKLTKSGDLALTVPGGGPLMVRKPIVYQLVNGKRQTVRGNFALRGRNRNGACRVGFALGSYDRNRALVIDPVVVYATYLGGSGFDSANSVAMMPDGGTVVVGSTQSPDFPGRSAPGTSQLAFAARFSPTGALVYMTLLGSDYNANGTGVAVDGAGNAYLAGDADSHFPTTPDAYAPQAQNQDEFRSLFLTRLNANGALTYSTRFGQPYYGQSVTDIKLDSAGRITLGGVTDAGRTGSFPVTPNAYQTVRRTAAAYRSRGGEFYWRDLHDGLEGVQQVNAFAFGTPNDGSIVYAATEQGVFKTSDGGATWTAINGSGDGGQLPTARVTSLLYIADLALSSSPILLAGVTDSDTTVAGVYQSSDDGATWQRTDSGDSVFQSPKTLVYPPGSPVFYVGDSNGGIFANDLTNTVSISDGLPGNNITALIYNPDNNTLYAGVAGKGVFALDVTGVLSVDDLGGRTWENRNGTGATALPLTYNYQTEQNDRPRQVNALLYRPAIPEDVALEAPARPAAIYAGLQSAPLGKPGGLYFSEDGGATWQQDTRGGTEYLDQYDILTLACDPNNPRLLFVGTDGGLITGNDDDSPNYRFNVLGFFNTYGVFGGYRAPIVAIAPGARATPNGNGQTFPIVFSGVNRDENDFSYSFRPTAAFVSRFDLSQTGTNQLVYSTLFGGSQPPVDVNNENTLRMAVSPSGAAFLAGTTNATDVPTTPGVLAPTFQMGDTGHDGFVVRFDPAQPGDASLVYSTYLGGNGDNYLTGIAVDASNRAHVAARTTYSPFQNAALNFPVTPGAFRTSFPYGSDYVTAVARLAADGSGLTYGTYLATNLYQVVSPALDSSGKIYLTGAGYYGLYTDSPRVNPLPGTTGGSLGEPFMILINPVGGGASDILFASSLGGSAYVDQNRSADGNALAVAVPPSGGSFYIVGRYSGFGNLVPSLQVVNPFQPVYNGGFFDAFAARVDVNVATPRLTSLSPVSAPAGSPATVVTLNGSGFAANSVVNVNGATRATTFVNATQLRVTLTTTDLASPKSLTLTVTTPGSLAPSNAQVFTVTPVGAPKLAFANIELLRTAPGNVILRFTITNTGTGAATNVRVTGGTAQYSDGTSVNFSSGYTLATLAAGANSGPIEISLGNAPAGTTATLSLKGSANGLSFTVTKRLPVP